jgi:2-phospho-L-lactate/phosphoenolpyruvate guanylyltransferase
MRTAAVLPVKRFARAKQRLRETVADRMRAALAEAMVADVLRALSHTDAIELTIVVSNEERVAAAASGLATVVIADAHEAGQSAAAALGISHALAAGFERALCVPGDCPALEPLELQALLAPTPRGSAAEVVIVPDRHGSGTNGLLLSPPDVIVPSFGPGSCERHLSLARAASARCGIARPPSLLLDVDTGADLQELRTRLADSSACAARTRALLGDSERSGAMLATGA